MEVNKVALMASDFEDGGVERNFTNLALGLARLGVETRFLVGNPDHPYLADLAMEEGVRVLPIVGGRAEFLRGILPHERPDVLLTGKLADDYAAVEARAGLSILSPIPTRLVAAVGTLLSGRFAAHRWNLLKTLRETRRIRACYARLDGITAISQGVAEDLRRVFAATEVPIAVLNNPILPEDVQEHAAARCPHPWLTEVAPDAAAVDRPPVIIAVGGLRKVKDFATLLRAFARLQDPRARLLILGEGKERASLTRLVDSLGIEARMDLHGFVPDPYPYIARSRLLVLSSRREGLGNAVVEALAVGTPVVATDCSHGLRALLGEGGLGPLVPVGDADALAAAISQCLGSVADGAALAAAAKPFELMPAARAHLEFFRRLSG